jgi:hypothetical protein
MPSLVSSFEIGCRTGGAIVQALSFSPKRDLCSDMAKSDRSRIKKTDLPTKVCATCGKPFAWRKKWERDWAQVKYCSDRCRMRKSGSLV